ncbi:hypothetical protein P153DRAFT_396659 [Dothidotthia symphoricarpi CBS 119687]|uniref:Uncharacterized protein n=1 Tax=Dothidotthia symphoricarpi CBS 119687 TaxID=1392245 RepID=A0A6A6AEL0_9PLEO|nr:uncharacterized protein P153DRAFT_396659 [Dothidotthia symphoricarpi CBS 119687]KAF2129384.1 hypothetical protein P153DRAFT_396659 [Dothidotthia symphoricarpi CBS 119687]
MCQYWRKMHTCEHPSDRPYLEMCKPGYLSNTVCPDIGEDPKPRKSYFPCWYCIKSEYRAEVEAEAAAKVTKQVQKMADFRARDELRIKEERVRREARERASREREEEVRRKMERAAREERAKKEGGLWIETGSGKKGKDRKGVSATSGPLSAPPVMKTIVAREKKENVAVNVGVGEGSDRKEKEKSLDLGGRAGTWGPKKMLSPEPLLPKKILSRKENIAVRENGGTKK